VVLRVTNVMLCLPELLREHCMPYIGMTSCHPSHESFQQAVVAYTTALHVLLEIKKIVVQNVSSIRGMNNYICAASILLQLDGPCC